ARPRRRARRSTRCRLRSAPATGSPACCTPMPAHPCPPPLPTDRASPSPPPAASNVGRGAPGPAPADPQGPPMRTTRLPRALGVLIAFLLAASLAACSGGRDDDGPQRLKIGAAALPASLDPRKSAPYEALWVGLLYDPLVRRAPDGTFHPGLAESWTFSEDNRTLELTLREGVTFQDGAPFTAQAVKANLDAAKAGKTNFTNYLSDVESVEVVDDRHVRLTLDEAAAPILGVLAGEAGMIISPQALSRDDLSTNPAGTGPYTLDSFGGSDLGFT